MSRTARTPIRTEMPEAETREPVRAKVRTRKGGVMADKYHVPPEWIPEGMDFQWNVDSVLGQPSVQERMLMEQQGWEAVDPSQEPFRHLDGKFMPAGHKGEINVGGLVLMYRPLELTLEARAEELNSARFARHAEESKVRAGRPDGVNPNLMDPTSGSAPSKNFIRKSMERIPSMPVQD